MAPLIRRCVHRGIPFSLIHTNQHYSHAMDRIFFDEFHLPLPNHELKATSSSYVEFTGNVLIGLSERWKAEKPSVVIVQGDTNTVAATAIAASRMVIPLAHVEAGLRSDDFAMPEEINRILTDHLSSRLYAPSEHQKHRLLMEGIDEQRVLITGNTVADGVMENLELAMKAPLPTYLQSLSRPYAVLTLHRPALVDDGSLLQITLMRIEHTFERMGIVGVFPAHPRTKDRIDAIGFSSSRIIVHQPLGYLSMLRLMSEAKCVITDSGGLQEETALLRIPCATLRATTERPETIDAGGNILIDPHSTSLEEDVMKFFDREIIWKQLYAIQYPSDTILADLLERYS